MNPAVVKSASYFPSADGKHSIHCIRWAPKESPRAVLQIAHGVAEHIGRYDDFASFLAGEGFLVAANDHLGHGMSAEGESELGWFGEKNGWELVVADMKTLHDSLRREYPELPIFLLGHSMGSFLSRTYMIRHPQDWSGVILSGTGQMPQLVCKAGVGVAKLVIRHRGSRYRSPLLDKLAFGSYLDEIEEPQCDKDWLSRDCEVIQKYMEDPLCGYMPSAGLMLEMMKGLAFIGKEENIKKMRALLPVFFVSGSEDPVGGWSKGVKLAVAGFKKAGMRDLKVRIYEGGRHEMLNELNKDEVYADILSWLNEKI